MPLINANEFRDRFVIKSDVPVDDAVSAAAVSIKEWVGSDAYADAEKLSDGSSATIPGDLPRAHKLRLAELYLAMYYYYPTASIQIESGVIVKTDRSEGESGGVIRSFEGAKERREGRQGYYDIARELAGPYLVLPVKATTPSSVVPMSKSISAKLI